MTPMNLGIPQIDNQVPQDSNLIQILAVFLLATCLMLSQTFGSKDLFGKEYTWNYTKNEGQKIKRETKALKYLATEYL